LLWALAGFALYLLCAIASLFITVLIADPLLTAIGLPVEAGTLGLSVRNALHPAVWGALVAAVSIPIGRRLVDGIRFSGAGWVVLGVGLVLATLTWFLSEEFVRARFESFDPEYVGLSLFAWPALVAVALCGWAALAVPRTGATPVIVLLVLAAAGLAVALLPSMGGASDGIEPGSVPLAVAFLVDVAYAISVIALVFRGATRPAPG
jgi:hypothetical protein